MIKTFNTKVVHKKYKLLKIRSLVQEHCSKYSSTKINSYLNKEGIKDRTNQGFTNFSSSRGSTIMFDLSKSITQLYPAIYGEKIYFFLYKHLNMVQERKKKSEKTALNFFLFFSCKIKLDFFYEGIIFFKIYDQNKKNMSKTIIELCI